MESPTHHPTAYALAPRRQQQAPLQSSSIRNLRTLFQLLSDEEFESEVEIERTRRATACRKKPHNKKRAPPSTAATDDTSRKKKKNSVSNVRLPVAATRAAAMRDTSPLHSPPPPRSALQPTMGFAMQPAAASGRQETKRQGWDEQYNALLEFKTEHGKVHVSKKEDSSLYWWIAVQRTAWRKFLKGDTTSAALTQTQVDRLIDIGLGTREGGPTNFANCNYSAAWESRFQQLVAFHKEFGHTEVSRHTHKDRFYKLAHWVEVQRGNYNHRLHMAATGKRKPGKWGIMTHDG